MKRLPFPANWQFNLIITIPFKVYQECCIVRKWMENQIINLRRSLSMGFHVQFEKPDVDVLKEYGRISIASEVSTEYNIELLNKGLGGMVFHEVKIEQPYIVDFDDEGGPERWLDRFDLKNWCVISAYEKGERVGGAVVAFMIPQMLMSLKEELILPFCGTSE